MAAGLPLSDIVNVTINLAPQAAPRRNFGAALHLGDGNVIDVGEGFRVYASLAGVGADHSVLSREYQAAAVHFSQRPQPKVLYIAPWAKTPRAGRLRGGVLGASERLVSNFTAVSAGSMQITVDGTVRTLSGLDFSGATNLNGVAAIIDTALAGASVVWDGNSNRFVLTSDTTGAASTFGYASATGAGTDISALLKLTSTTASAPVAGIPAETLVQALARAIDATGDWYSALILPPVASPAEALAASALIEGQGKKRIIGYTIQDSRVLDPTSTNDLGFILKDANYARTYSQYSSTSPYAIASFFARASTVNFDVSNSTLTMKFKQQPGIAAETLTETQAKALKDKRVNVFVNYDNDTAIVQHGTMAGRYWFDEIHGLDWLENDIQTANYNALYSSPTKIPQTDAGNAQLKAVSESRLEQAVTNGLLAPGIWNGPEIVAPNGAPILSPGDMLEAGYLVYVAPVATQAQADREDRHGVPQQIAAKLAGAIHDVDVLITVNR